MAKQETKKSGGNKKHTRDAEKCKLYRQRQIREKNKSKRVLQSSGKKACERYCKLHRIKLPDNYYKIRDNKT